jgi:hypothetical protein
MRRTDRTTRTANLAVTATTLVALAAMAAGAPSLRGIEAARVVETEVLSSFGESPAVRAVAAAVAAAARDLLRGKSATIALPAAWIIGDVSAAPATPRPAVDPVICTTATDWLGPRLLDLPPPAC